MELASKVRYYRQDKIYPNEVVIEGEQELHRFERRNALEPFPSYRFREGVSKGGGAKGFDKLVFESAADATTALVVLRGLKDIA